VTTAAFDHCLTELDQIPAARLTDADALASLVVAAAGAIGISAGTPPVIQEGPLGLAVALLCLDGHIVLHTSPKSGGCLVDIVVRVPGSAARGLGVIARRLSSPASPGSRA
jgi:S-adenosylmethionine/arginine decarboxylase-like enzyme